MSAQKTKRFLVTAGGTREPIDRVRDWGNVFTGNTGFGIARALSAAGNVDLLTSNLDHQRQLAGAGEDDVLRAIPFKSHGDLRQALATLLATQQYHAVFMTAAVSDYGPAGAYEVLSRTPDPTNPGQEVWTVKNAHAGKIKSAFEELAILGRRTSKLVDLFRTDWAYSGILVKFKLEVGVDRETLIRIGQASRKASGANYLVANTLDMVSGMNAGAFLLSDGDPEWVLRHELPERLRRLVD